MAKTKVKVTAAMAAEAEPHFTQAIAGKLTAMGAGRAARRFRSKEHLAMRQRRAKKDYQRFLDEGGKVGDWQSFMTWLLEHADEIIAFISKIIALFSVCVLALVTAALARVGVYLAVA